MHAPFLPRDRRPAPLRHRRRPSDRVRRGTPLDRPLAELSRSVWRWLRTLAR